jgi:hypothetical protein
MRSLIAAVLAIVLLLIAATPVLGDGGFIGSDPAEDIYQPAQKAVILHENGREDLILQVKYEGDVDEFAWIVPVPGYPDVDVSQPEMFEELAYFTAVEAYDSDGGFFACLPAGGGFDASEVEVWEEDAVGVYEYAILSAADPQALVDWLNTNGYPFPEEGAETVDYYIDKEWYFVALRINAGEAAEGLAEGTVQPLRLSFDSDDIVYPLKITSLSSDRCEVLLYVFADKEVVPREYGHLALKRPEQVIDLERVDDVFYVECTDQVCLQNSTYGHCGPSTAWSYWGYELTEFSDLLAGDQYRLTKLQGSIGAASMVDIELIGYEEERYLDSDEDGWSDDEEEIAGTNPNKADTDGDGEQDPEDPYPLRSSSAFCFIATAAYGSPVDSRVEVLREFRDSYLMTNPVGRSLTSAYYRLSPPAAQFIVDHPSLKPPVQAALWPAVALSAAAVNTALVHIVAIAGALALVSLALVWWLRRRTTGGAHTDA